MSEQKTALDDLVMLCQLAGERFDLVQAGGGNASYQHDNSMWIKASGISLSEVTCERGICELDRAAIKSVVENLSSLEKQIAKEELVKRANNAVDAAVRTTSTKPSIETLLHCLFGPYTLHTHPTIVTSLVCQPAWRDKIAFLFPDAIKVSYHTPGIMLAIAIRDALNEQSKSTEGTNIVFLENHGLIVSGEDAESVLGLTDEVVEKLSTLLGVDWSHYSLSNRISELLMKIDNQFHCAYYCEDRVLRDAVISKTSLVLSQPTCPDQVVYCGAVGIEITSLSDMEPIKRYVDRFNDIPKVIVYEDHLFLIGRNVKKCKESEEVLKSHVLTLSVATPKVQFLANKELDYLMNWDAEKYRQRI